MSIAIHRYPFGPFLYKDISICLVLLAFAAHGTAQSSAPMLRDVAPFPVGAAISPALLRTKPAYRSVTAQEFNSLTPENCMKMYAIYKDSSRYDFADADSLVAFAQQHRQRVHAHALVWHWYSRIGWLRRWSGDSLAWEKLFKTYIADVASRYRGKVASWDVVNEAFHDDGTLRVHDRDTTDKEDDGSIFARQLGPDYLARAFQYAHAADPEALLFYNDYGQEGHPAKTAAIDRMVRDFRQRGIPIHGLGLQMHLGIGASKRGIRTAIRAAAGTGLLIHISELDILVSDWKKNPDLQYTPRLQRRHAQMYRFVVRTFCREVPPAQRYGITLWGVTDAHTWVTGLGFRDFPLLFDTEYRRKGVYQAFVKGLP
jgi:endo-1,4-beta-xylanase